VRSVAGAVFVLAGALAACDAPRPANPRLWTLFDVDALYAGGADSTTPIAADAGVPGGVAIGSMLEADRKTLYVHPSWAESYATGYVTTEVWSRFDQVWVQPMYVPVTGWTGGQPQRVVDAGGDFHPIFGVGPDSAFYSPFWQLIYADVPADTADGALTSARQIIDGRYPLHPSTSWVAPLGPPGSQPLALDTTLLPSGGTKSGTGWVDGAPVAYLQFPGAPLGWDDDLAVAEVPIFHFIFLRDDGTLVAPDIPSVLGTGPLYANTPAPIDMNGRATPRYNAYWRVYTVTVPPGARVFAPPSSSLAGALQDAGVPTDIPGGLSYDTRFEGYPLDDLLGRVAVNPDCFTSLDSSDPHGGTCVYLDSQADIEGNLPRGAIARTDVTVTCPLVSFQGKALTP
jgi:hypothetical protein